MNTVVTSRESILETSRELIRTQGWEAVNIRNVAKARNISVGSIYNYFQNKSSLIGATVESVWCDIFHVPKNPLVFDSFTECVEWAFACMRSGNEKYPDFFTMHSIGFIGEEKQSGQELMEKSWEHIKTGFFTVLMGDKRVNRAVFNEIFTPKRFVEIVFSLILSSLIQQDYDSAAIVKMIELILYR